MHPTHLVREVVASVPWWDHAWPGNVLVLAGVIAAWLIYLRQRHVTTVEEQQSAVAHLQGVQAAISTFDNFFTTSYAGDAAIDRADDDRLMIMKRTHNSNFLVPITPFRSLIELGGYSRFYSSETVRTANVALAKVTIFNQFVQQQTDFNLLHLAEVMGDHDDGRTSIALAAKAISFAIHRAIDDAKWHQELKVALDANIGELQARIAKNQKWFHGFRSTSVVYNVDGGRQ